MGCVIEFNESDDVQVVVGNYVVHDFSGKPIS
jgi:hypothetical protein